MDILDYTTYDDIRSVLGVHSEELEDDILALATYAQHLEIEFDEIDDNLRSNFDSVAVLLSWTRPQTKFMNIGSLFATYSIANHLVSSLTLFAPKRITDGNAETERITDPFASIRESIPQHYSLMKSRLIQAYESLYGATVPTAPTFTFPTISIATGLATDPVTG
jgi:hypothetical protein